MVGLSLFLELAMSMCGVWGCVHAIKRRPIRMQFHVQVNYISQLSALSSGTSADLNAMTQCKKRRPNLLQIQRCTLNMRRVDAHSSKFTMRFSCLCKFSYLVMQMIYSLFLSKMHLYARPFFSKFSFYMVNFWDSPMRKKWFGEKMKRPRNCAPS